MEFSISWAEGASCRYGVINTDNDGTDMEAGGSGWHWGVVVFLWHQSPVLLLLLAINGKNGESNTRGPNYYPMRCYGEKGWPNAMEYKQLYSTF